MSIGLKAMHFKRLSDLLVMANDHQLHFMAEVVAKEIRQRKRIKHMLTYMPYIEVK